MNRSLADKENNNLREAKIKPRINLLKKLAGTFCTVVNLFSGRIFSPAWLNTAHTSSIDVALYKALRLITGTVSSTPTEH